MTRPESVHNDSESSPLLHAAILGAALVGSAVTLDLTSQVALWRKRPTEIVSALTHELPDDTPRWLAISGLGRSSAQSMAESLSDVIPGPKDYAIWSDRGLSGKRFGRALRQYYNSYYPEQDGVQTKQNVLVHSMGLPTFLMGIEWCLKNEVAVPPVDTLIAFSSPLGAEHTYMERQIQLLARYPYPGGVLSKLAVEFYQRFETERFKPAALRQAALGALSCSYRDCSPAIWSSQVRTIARDTNYIGSLSTVITPATTIVHYGDKEDPTVNVPMARYGLEKVFARKLGARFIAVDTPGDGHDTVTGSKTREDLLRRFAVSV